ncbi:protein brambleberry-like isoform X2 [Anneissia japonica]|nr:protein brambleberry-like isoform X2 [Anneissia japonica]XP_033104667.1 protein brambleberry-like isoform X2 [Anneissia japonica]
MWSKSSQHDDETRGNINDQVDGGDKVSLDLMRRRVPFELKSVEEKFLSSGTALIQLSELDSCQHKVIADLNTLCEHITEEQLAKLGVALLNCQSKAEGRPTYVCTEEMTVSECTGPMDPNTWNAYHIVSNRARSVCYSVRQQQFQSKTQQTVNNLAASAANQLQIMNFLQEGQETLNGMAKETFETISESQEELMSKHEILKTSQTELHHNIEENMKDLTREKALIASGHKELADMTETIRKQLENATQQLFAQGDDHRQNHQELLKDLLSIQDKAKQVWNKLDDNMEHVTLHQNEASQYYQDAMDNMKKMNDTVIYLVNRVNEMQNGIDKQLTWLSNLVQSTGTSLDVVSICVQHACYFVLAAIAITFVYTPVFSRMMLLFLVPLNALAEIRHMTSLDFASMTFVLFITVIINWLVILFYNVKDRNKDPVSVPVHNPVHQSPVALPSTSPVGLPERFKLDNDVINLASSEYSSISDNTYMPNSTRILASSCDPSSSDTTLSTSSMLMPILESTHMDSTANHPDVTPIPTGTEFAGSFGSSTFNPAKRHLGVVMENVTSATPNSKTDSAKKRSRSASPNRLPCSGFTKTGQPCRLPRAIGKGFCYRHTE